MGSLDKACISGFLCRLCSEMHRTVIHIYGEQGQKHRLLEKINGYLPVTITPTDPLPKTICANCMKRVEQHYELLIRISQYGGLEKRELRPRLLRTRLGNADGSGPLARDRLEARRLRRSATSNSNRTSSSLICETAEPDVEMSDSNNSNDSNIINSSSNSNNSDNSNNEQQSVDL